MGEENELEYPGLCPEFGSLSRESWRTTLHLACLRGPDHGTVIPVQQGRVIGRLLGLTDPYTSASHAVFMRTETRWYCQDRGGLNPISSWPGRPIRLRPGRTVRIGSNLWLVRSAAQVRPWGPGSARKTRLRGFGFLFPLIILGSLLRWLPTQMLPGIAIFGTLLVVIVSSWFLRQRGRKRDPAHLLLLLAECVTRGRPLGDRGNADPSKEWIEVIVRPGGRRTMKIRPMRKYVVVGRSPEAYALWLAAQIRCSGHSCLVVPAKQHTQLEPAEMAVSTVLLAWANEVEEIGFIPHRVLSSRPVGGWLWQQEVASLLDGEGQQALPEHVDFDVLCKAKGISPARGAECNLWAENSRNRGGTLATQVPIGVEARGSPRYLDLDKDGPHGLIIGGTGSGKSELLCTIVMALAVSHAPDRLRFIFIDYKGGAGLEHLAGLPHVEHCINDLDGQQTPWLLRAIRATLRERKRQMSTFGYRSLSQWADDEDPAAPPPPHLVIVADEVRALAEHSPALLKELSSVCAQGRSLGLHVIAASQRLGGAIDQSMRAVLDLRIALRCSEAQDSLDCIGSRAASTLPRLPGRALVGSTCIQVAYCHDPTSWVDALSSRAKVADVMPVIAKPLAQNDTELERVLIDEEIASSPAGQMATLLGMFEDPESCRAIPLVWAGQPMVLTGTRQSADELTELALTAALRTRSAYPPTQVHWIGPFPMHLGAAAKRVIATCPIEPCSGDLLYFLEALVSRTPSSPAVVVIPNLSETRRRLETECGLEGTRRIIANLVTLAHRGEVHLIATDTEHSSLHESFTSRLERLPPQGDRGRFQSAELRATNSVSGATITDLTSSTTGRMCLHGASGGPAAAQLFNTPPKDLSEAQPGLLELNCGLPEPQGLRLRSETLTLVIVGATDGQATSVENLLAPHGSFRQVHHLDSTEWGKIRWAANTVVAAITPSRELLRLMQRHSANGAAWASGYFPFPDGTGLVLHQRKVERLILA